MVFELPTQPLVLAEWLNWQTHRIKNPVSYQREPMNAWGHFGDKVANLICIHDMFITSF